MKDTILYPAIVLPGAASLTGTRLGYETENVNDAVVHYSDPVIVQHLQEKKFQVYTMEIITVASPGNLQVWVEIAPYDYTQMLAGIITPGTWTQLAIPTIVVASGVSLTAHSNILQWTTHSFYARLGTQAPGASAPDYWTAQASIEGKG